MPKTNLEFNFSVTINLRSFKIKSIQFLDFRAIMNGLKIHKISRKWENIHVVKYRGFEYELYTKITDVYFQTFFYLWLQKIVSENWFWKISRKWNFSYSRVILSIHRLIWTFGSELLGLAKHKQRYYGAYRSFSL